VLGNDVDGLRSLHQRLSQFGQSILQAGGGDFDSGCHALNFERRPVESSHLIADPRTSQELLQCHLGSVEPGYAGDQMPRIESRGIVTLNWAVFS